MGESAVKGYLLDMAQLLHSWNYSSCGQLQSPVQDQASQNYSMDEGNHEAPTPEKLLAVENYRRERTILLGSVATSRLLMIHMKYFREREKKNYE